MRMKFALACFVYVFAIVVYEKTEAATITILDKVKALICDNYIPNKCPTGWLLYKRKCYFFSADKVSWDDAEESCRNKNAHLAKVDDYDENNWIVANSKASNDYRHILWIGGNDKAKEGEWRWTADQSLFVFKHWDFDYKEPNGGKEENCLNLMWKSSDGRWNDNACTEKFAYVCEMNKI